MGLSLCPVGPGEICRSQELLECRGMGNIAVRNKTWVRGSYGKSSVSLG